MDGLPIGKSSTDRHGIPALVGMDRSMASTYRCPVKDVRRITGQCLSFFSCLNCVSRVQAKAEPLKPNSRKRGDKYIVGLLSDYSNLRAIVRRLRHPTPEQPSYKLYRTKTIQLVANHPTAHHASNRHGTRCRFGSYQVSSASGLPSSSAHMLACPAAATPEQVLSCWSSTLPSYSQHFSQNVPNTNRERCLWRDPGPRRPILGSPDGAIS